MNGKHAFIGISPTDDGCSLVTLFPTFTTANYRVRLTELRQFDAREEHRELFEYLYRELHDVRTPLGGAEAVNITAEIGQGIRGQLLLEGLRRVQRERFRREPMFAAVILVPTGETISRPEGYGFPKVPRPLALASLVRVAAGSRLDIEQKGKLAREFLAQLEASRQKRAKDDETVYDLVDAVSLAAYTLHRKAAPVVARMEEERRRRAS